MGMQHGWVPHLPPGTGSSAPHVLQGSQTLQTYCCSIDAVHVCPLVELQPATASMGTVTATLVPTRQIAPAMRATLETTVRWMTVSVKQSQHYCYALYHV